MIVWVYLEVKAAFVFGMTLNGLSLACYSRGAQQFPLCSLVVRDVSRDLVLNFLSWHWLLDGHNFLSLNLLRICICSVRLAWHTRFLLLDSYDVFLIKFSFNLRVFILCASCVFVDDIGAIQTVHLFEINCFTFDDVLDWQNKRTTLFTRNVQIAEGSGKSMILDKKEDLGLSRV